jgi:hypothetical protein
MAARFEQTCCGGGRLVTRTCTVWRAAQLVSRTSVGLVHFSQSLSQGARGTSSFADARRIVSSGRRTKERHPAIRFKRRGTQQCRCAQRSFERHAQAAYWNRPGRGKEPIPAASETNCPNSLRLFLFCLSIIHRLLNQLIHSPGDPLGRQIKIVGQDGEGDLLPTHGLRVA